MRPAERTRCASLNQDTHNPLSQRKRHWATMCTAIGIQIWIPIELLHEAIERSFCALLRARVCVLVCGCAGVRVCDSVRLRVLLPLPFPFSFSFWLSVCFSSDSFALWFISIFVALKNICLCPSPQRHFVYLCLVVVLAVVFVVFVVVVVAARQPVAIIIIIMHCCCLCFVISANNFEAMFCAAFVLSEISHLASFSQLFFTFCFFFLFFFVVMLFSLLLLLLHHLWLLQHWPGPFSIVNASTRPP